MTTLTNSFTEKVNNINRDLSKLKEVFHKKPLEDTDNYINEIHKQLIELEQYNAGTSEKNTLIGRKTIRCLKIGRTVTGAIFVLGSTAELVANAMEMRNYDDKDCVKTQAAAILSLASVVMFVASGLIHLCYDTANKKQQEIEEERKEQRKLEKFGALQYNKFLEAFANFVSESKSQNTLAESPENAQISSSNLNEQLDQCFKELNMLVRFRPHAELDKEEWTAHILSHLPANHPLREKIAEIHQLASSENLLKEDEDEIEKTEQAGNEEVRTGVQNQSTNLEFNAKWKQLEDQVGHLRYIIQLNAGTLEKITRKGDIAALTLEEDAVKMHLV
jgi:hypothetical protein